MIINQHVNELKNKTYDQITLNGKWEFAYTNETLDFTGLQPRDEEYLCRMPVPGCWDDCIDQLKKKFTDKLKYNPDFLPIEFPMLDEFPPDASLQYIIGTGWYKTNITLSIEQDSHVYLNASKIRMQAGFWLNGKFAGKHLCHSVPARIDITEFVKKGDNEIVIAVSNENYSKFGCDVRGYKGYCGGITGDLWLDITGVASIDDIFIHFCSDTQKIYCIAELGGKIPMGTKLNWKIYDKKDNQQVIDGSIAIDNNLMEWQLPAEHFNLWSDIEPTLYSLNIEIVEDDKIYDSTNQDFGIRDLKTSDSRIFLNGNPLYLRGATEHAYFPQSCAEPDSISYYRDIIKKLKSIGFNWLRFHTWIPNEKYLQAADEIGMLIQVEPPVNFTLEEWKQIIKYCRKHPSVIIYCCGNEEFLDDAKIDYLSQCAETQKDCAPNSLFNPQEALRGVEYWWDEKTIPKQMKSEPFEYNYKKLADLEKFSDCFGHYSWGYLSYCSVKAKQKGLNNRQKIYNRPLLAHEITIQSSFIDSTLDPRYEDTKIGNDFSIQLQKIFREKGIEQKADLYYRNSVKWMESVRKHTVEMTRKCEKITGYDLLGAIDYHWHRTGYSCGIMNEFYELKPGITEEEILNYNNASVLLLEDMPTRNLTIGNQYNFNILISHFINYPLNDIVLNASVVTEERKVICENIFKIDTIDQGVLKKLATLKFTVPDNIKSSKVFVTVRLTCGSIILKNSWPFWLFASSDWNISSTETLKIINEINEEVISYLDNGGNVILLGRGPFPAKETTFQPAIAGRRDGSTATVIYDHPIVKDFAHDGYCDWQFFDMLEAGSAVDFDDLDIEFSPIIELVNSYKLIRKQALLFETTVGKGLLLVCTLNLKSDDPAASFLLECMKSYMSNPSKQLAVDVAPDTLRGIVKKCYDISPIGNTDMAFDPNAAFF